MTREIVEIDYTNWRGERRKRLVIPLSWTFAANEWHKTPQWLMRAIDMDTTGEKTFAMSGIHSWKPSPDADA